MKRIKSEGEVSELEPNKAVIKKWKTKQNNNKSKQQQQTRVVATKTSEWFVTLE